MLECPRSAFTPPPGRPTFPRRSCSIAAVRMICTPVECCVQPRAYMTVPTFSALPLDVLLEQLEDAARVLQRRVEVVAGGRRIGLVRPLRLVVLLLGRVEPGEETLVEGVLLADD